MSKLLDNLRKKHAGDQPKANRHAVNFLAHKEEIAEAMREGWTAKQIWEQMVEDGMTTMSYANLCRLVKKHVTPTRYDVNDVPASPIQSQPNAPTKKSKQPEQKLKERERLGILKEEAFASVRSSKPTGSLIGKPKTRDEENEELFG